jgi:hypothetical protein
VGAVEVVELRDFDAFCQEAARQDGEEHSEDRPDPSERPTRTSSAVPISSERRSAQGREPLAAFRRDLGARADRGYVIHGGDVLLPLGPDATAWPFGRLQHPDGVLRASTTRFA